jgi:hypothetical protein
VRVVAWTARGICNTGQLIPLQWIIRFLLIKVLWYLGLTDKTNPGTVGPWDRRSLQYRLRYSVPELTSVGQVGVIEAVLIVRPMWRG